jgi:hypothetical protein
MGLAVGADAIRYLSIDIDLRALADRLYIKALGKEALPKQLNYVYKYISLKSIMRMPKPRFGIVTRMGTIGRGAFAFPPWHKTEQEDLLKMFDIRRDFGDGIDYGDKGWCHISDFEHRDFVELRINRKMMMKDGKLKPATYERIGKKFGHSGSAIKKHLWDHNQEIEDKGFCQKCKAVKSPYMGTKVPTSRL